MTDRASIVVGDDSVARCAWVGTDPEYQRYHDEEWGTPLHGDRPLYEKISLEGFQAGLSWLTILNKRPAFTAAYRGFDVDRVARFGNRDVERLMADPGIIRNRLKVEAAIENARRIRGLRKSHGSFAAWLDAHHPRSKAEWVKLFKETFRFTGGEITGEFLLSLGYLPGAHALECPVHRRIGRLRPPWSRVEDR